MKCLVVKKSTFNILASVKDIEKKVKAYRPLNNEEVSEFLDFVDTHKQFLERFGEAGVENNEDYFQIIFYCIIKKRDSFFVYQRGGSNSAINEKRLAMKIAVGVGGHIEPFDKKPINSLYREIDEELEFRKNGEQIVLAREGAIDIEVFNKIMDMRIVGILKDESDPVGRVHLGVVSLVTILDNEIDVSIRENDGNIFGEFMIKGQFQLKIEEKQFDPEGWTRIIFENGIL